nr:uncharacterized protein LOC124811456 [Hydra vulgaris]
MFLMQFHLSLSEVPRFFNESILRQNEYEKLFELMNPNNKRVETPSLFQKFSATGWLVRGKCFYNLLVNWQELKAFFICAEMNANSEVRYKISSISKMFQDSTLYLYVVLLTPVIQEFERRNSLFQGSNVNPEDLINELNMHLKSLKQLVFDTKGFVIPLQCVDFGAKLSSECQIYIQGQPPNAKLNAEESVKNVKIRFHDFIQRAITELEKRLPENRLIFDGLSNLSPMKFFSQVEKFPFSKLLFPHLMGTKSRN